MLNPYDWIINLNNCNSKNTTYHPRCSFSFNMVEPAKATITSIRGLKTETNNGPLILMHHEITTTIIPETTIPYNTIQTTTFCI